MRQKDTKNNNNNNNISNTLVYAEECANLGDKYLHDKWLNMLMSSHLVDECLIHHKAITIKLIIPLEELVLQKKKKKRTTTKTEQRSGRTIQRLAV